MTTATGIETESEAGADHAVLDPAPDLRAAPRGRDEVVEALITSAIELFARRGIDGTSVREIAGGAGVNHALVFRHFGSKARLARTVLDRLLDDLLGQFRGVGLDPIALARIGETAAEREDLLAILTRAVLDGEVDFLTEREFPEIEAVVEAMERAAQAGLMTAALPPRLLLLVVLSGALGWALADPVLAAIVGTPGETPARRRELAQAAFMSTVGAPAIGSVRLTPQEEERARVPAEAPARIQAESRPQKPVSEGPPRGRDQVVPALIEAAMTLYAERGPAAVSVREIAAEAGVNHALVFRHFGSKEGLTQAVWDRVVEDLAQRIIGEPDYASIVAFSEAIARDERLCKLAVRALLDGGAETIAAVRYHFVDTLVWSAERGRKAGLLDARIHPRMLVAMTIATGIGFLVFHPVLRSLLGMPRSDAETEREQMRTAIARLVGWHRLA